MMRGPAKKSGPPQFLNPDSRGVCAYEGDDLDPAVDIATVYREYHRRVFRWCFRIVRNLEDAEDLTQDAFMHVMCRIHTFRGEASFSSWLYRVVTNTVFMRLRKKRLPETSLDEFVAFAEDTLWPRNISFLADTVSRDPDAHIDLTRAINQIPRGFRTAFYLHDVEDYTHAEIAAIRGWSVGTSKSQLHKARRRLRALLAYDRGEARL